MSCSKIWTSRAGVADTPRTSCSSMRSSTTYTAIEPFPEKGPRFREPSATWHSQENLNQSLRFIADTSISVCVHCALT